MRTLAYRLAPGVDLKAELERITRVEGLGAGFILTAVGSLSRARLRMPGAVGAESAYRDFEGPLEIVSLTGRSDRTAFTSTSPSPVPTAPALADTSRPVASSTRQRSW